MEPILVPQDLAQAPRDAPYIGGGLLAPSDETGDDLEVVMLEEVEHTVRTLDGLIVCGVRGNLKPNSNVLVTLPDIGTTHTSCFLQLVNHQKLRPLLARMVVIQMNWLGQTPGARTLTDEEFPTLEQQSEYIGAVARHFKLTHFVGLGAGAGGLVMLHYAMNHQETVRGLVLVGMTSRAASWSEKMRQMFTSNLLPATYSRADVEKQLMLRWFGSETPNDVPGDVLAALRSSLNSAANLLPFFRRLINREDCTERAKKLTCKVLVCVSRESDEYERTMDMVAEAPASWSMMETETGGSLLTVSHPGELCKPIELFFAGLGIVAPHYT